MTLQKMCEFHQRQHAIEKHHRPPIHPNYYANPKRWSTHFAINVTANQQESNEMCAPLNQDQEATIEPLSTQIWTISTSPAASTKLYLFVEPDNVQCALCICTFKCQIVSHFNLSAAQIHSKGIRFDCAMCASAHCAHRIDLLSAQLSILRMAQQHQRADE